MMCWVSPLEANISLRPGVGWQKAGKEIEKAPRSKERPKTEET